MGGPIKKISAAARMASGSFTPFLLADWGGEERAGIEAWLRGENFADALAALERELAASLGDGVYVRAANLGRTAVQIALEAFRLEPGAEVILPSFSCLGLILPVVQAGLKPVLADVDDDMNISAESVLEAATERTGAVIVPHLSGLRAAGAEKIIEWAGKNGVRVIEDAAQAQGLEYAGKPAGLNGDAGIFSAHGGKMILSSGGGWVAVRDNELAGRIAEAQLAPEPREAVTRRVSEFAVSFASAPAAQGRKALSAILSAKAAAGKPADPYAQADARDARFDTFTLIGIEAKLILSQLPVVAGRVEARRANAARWRGLISKLPLETVRMLPDTDNVHVKTLLTFSGAGAERESAAVRAALLAGGVETEQSYTPLHLRSPFDGCGRTALPVTETRWRGAFALPVRPNLSERDFARIEAAAAKITP